VNSEKKLEHILPDPALHEVLERIQKGEGHLRLGGLRGSSKSLLLSILSKILERPLLVVSATPEEALDLCRDIGFFRGNGTTLFPAWDILDAGVLAPRRDVELRRAEALHRLAAGEAVIVVAPLAAVLQKVVPKDIFTSFVERISIGDTLDRDRLAEKLVSGGYRRLPLVEEEGDFSIRGNVIDVYPPGAPRPYRMLFAGDEIESIREFDAASQRSGRELDEFTLPPARELILTADARARALSNLRNRANELDLPRATRDYLAEMVSEDLDGPLNPQLLPLYYADPEGPRGLEPLPGYLGSRSIVVFDDPLALRRSGDRLEEELDRFIKRAKDEEKYYPEKESLYVETESVFAHGDGQRLLLESLELDGASPGETAIRFRTETDLGIGQDRAATISKEESILAPVAEKIRGWVGEGNLVEFLCAGKEDVHRMTHLLEAHGLPIVQTTDAFAGDLARHGERGGLVLREGRIGQGFFFPGLRLVIFSEEEIFGKKTRQRRPRPAREGYFLRSFGELQEGDFVVHTDHGIGIYQGLKRLAVGDIENDFLLLEYLNSDRLYIPVHRLDMIQRYIGPDGHAPKVDRLGGTSWETAKRRVKKAVHEIAGELVSLYAARGVLDGHAYGPLDRYYGEFASAFEYEETQDQARAIEDIHFDMGSPKPMDRLICGDAGFGKTEVAIRAAFRAVMEGKQVAMLVPTTILAEQHYQTFSRRLARHPVRVEVLSRFRTREQQKRIVEDLAKGSVDIVIGTHRVLQKDVAFKDLGLVIIDEEQRFGVSHKEKLKKLRTLVDVLTLTATPIPRTLQLSLVGIRDLSIINTPPEGRLSIKTYVLEFDEGVIIDAIRGEIRRGGQVFFLHDRVQSIDRVAGMIRKLVPECRVAVAHGQMKSRELEDVMVRFLRREYDVLVSTTIIGSGLDIPTANTIIINRADRFGLSQLYQLRGRVGRSTEEARAYLLIPKGAPLPKDAQKRLQVIKEFTDPGSGFQIASHDLEIRGAGNLVGMSQSGHISAVGYEMYITLMEKAVRELKGEPLREEEIRPEINLGLPAFIPDEYITDMHRRLVTYKRLSMAASDEDVNDIREELMDCFGFVPTQVENLLEVIGIRNRLKAVMGERMDYDGKGLSITFHRESTIDPARILKLSKTRMKGLRLTPDHRLSLPLPGLKDEDILRQAKNILQELTAS
jgi:transcription-repair coupling factor (superfamily II helicase)